jgi:hypothetical protein
VQRSQHVELGVRQAELGIVGGRIIKRDGKLLHHDVRSLLAALAESADHLTTSQ